MIREFSLPLSRPLATARGTIDDRRGFVFAKGGGVGEATPLPGWTEPIEACERALRDADDAADWDAGVAVCREAPAARHAVSLARLDAETRAAGESLAVRLAGDGGRSPAASVPVNATVGDATADHTADAVCEAADDGFETVKLKVGARAVAEDVERVRAASEAADVTLRVDANGSWTTSEAREAFDALAGLDADLAYVEQPMPEGNLDVLRDLADGPVALALDESLTAHPLADVLDVADVVVLKPMALGGVDRAREAARAAREAGVEPVVSNTVDAVVARTAAVHLAASIPDIAACGLATADRLETDLAPDPAPVADGRVPVPDGPGHGVEGVLADAGTEVGTDA